MEPRWDADLGRYEWGPPASPEAPPTIEPAFIREAVVNLDVIDGASGGTTRLWSGAFGGIPVNSQVNIVIPDCMLIGTAATALTIEFSAAGAAASFEFVNLQGFSVS